MSEIKAKKRKRPRTAQIRQDLKKSLECSILTPRSPILPLFTKNKDHLVGNLFHIIQHLTFDEKIEKFLNLSTFALKSLNNRTKIFTILDGENSNKKEDLKIAFHRKLRSRIFETIAFVDNLPVLCTKERLWRRATLFGTVVDVHLPKPRKIFQKQGILKSSIKVEHAGYGFVQFTSPYSVKRFCKRYSTNSHLRRHGKRSRKTKRARLLSKSQQSNENFHESTENLKHDELSKISHEYSITNSNVEWSESGMESDFDIGPVRKRRTTFNVSVMEISEKFEKKSTENVKKRKIRRKKSLKPGNVSLRRLFRFIQVFPLRTYKILKKEYYHMKKQIRQIHHVELEQQKFDDSD